MTPEQALDLLDQATAALTTNRASHAQIMEALKVLKDLIEKQKPLS
jgi:hypothetical protein